MTRSTHMEFTFRSLIEGRPGAVWKREFNVLWPAYRRWVSREGDRPPTFLQSLKALRRHMPTLLPVYETMVELAGGGDHAARF